MYSLKNGKANYDNEEGKYLATTPNSNSIQTSITDKVNINKSRGARVSPLKMKAKDISRMNKPNQYYTKTMAGVKNNA